MHPSIHVYNYIFDKNTWGLDNWDISMLKSMLVNKNFETWFLIGWQHSQQPWLASNTISSQSEGIYHICIRM